MARRVILSGAVTTSSAKVKDAASATSITALAANSTKIPHLHGIVISTNTAGTYTVKIGSTEIFDFYLGDNSGYTGIFAPYYITNETVNEAITVTKPIGATTSVTTFYTLEPAL